MKKRIISTKKKTKKKILLSLGRLATLKEIKKEVKIICSCGCCSR